MQIVLFHHALGVTPGVTALAERLRSSGHDVVVPDLYEGATFESIDDGVAHAQSVGFDVIADRGVAAAAAVAAPFVVMGISLGAVPAQRLAQTDGGVAGAVLCSGALPVDAFGEEWPASVPVEIHLGESDPWAQEDLDAARELAEVSGGRLHLHRTERHLFVDSSHADHDPRLADAVVDAVERFLAVLEIGD